MEAFNREINVFLGAAEQLFIKVGGIRPHELSQNLFFVEDFPVETAFYFCDIRNLQIHNILGSDWIAYTLWHLTGQTYSIHFQVVRTWTVPEVADPDLNEACWPSYWMNDVMNERILFERSFFCTSYWMSELIGWAKFFWANTEMNELFN